MQAAPSPCRMVELRASTRAQSRMSPLKKGHAQPSLLREQIAQLVSAHSLQNALFWLHHLCSSPDIDAHWSDAWNLCRVLLMDDPHNASVVADYISSLPSERREQPAFVLLYGQVLARLQRWQELVEHCQHERTMHGTDSSTADEHPAGWVPRIADGETHLLELLGLAKKHLLLFDDARTAFERTLDLMPHSHVAFGHLAHDAHALLAPTQRTALAAPTAFRGEDSASSSSLLERAMLLFDRGTYDEAHDIVTQLMRAPIALANQDLVTLHISLLAQLDKRIALFALGHRLVDTYPQRPSTWYCVALYYQLHGRHASAQSYYLKCCAIDAHYAPGWLAMGHAFAQAGEHEQAVAAYTHAMRRIAPGSLHAGGVFLASEYLRTRQTALASACLLEVYARNSAEPAVLNELGVLYWVRKDTDKALACFRRALESAEELHLALAVRCNIATILLKQPSYAHVHQAVALTTVDPALLASHTQPEYLCAASLARELAFYSSADSSLLAQALELANLVLRKHKGHKLAQAAHERLRLQLVNLRTPDRTSFALRVESSPSEHTDDRRRSLRGQLTRLSFINT